VTSRPSDRQSCLISPGATPVPTCKPRSHSKHQKGRKGLSNPTEKKQLRLVNPEGLTRHGIVDALLYFRTELKTQGNVITWQNSQDTQHGKFRPSRKRASAGEFEIACQTECLLTTVHIPGSLRMRTNRDADQSEARAHVTMKIPRQIK
jgi:hypothetical protein